MSVVLNAGLDADQLGATLAEFHSFTSSFPPTLKGEAIAASDDIRKAHNAFSRKDAFLHESSLRLPTGDEDVFHFVRLFLFVCGALDKEFGARTASLCWQLFANNLHAWIFCRLPIFLPMGPSTS